MTPRQGIQGQNVDVRKGNIPTCIDRNLGYALEFNGTDEYLQIALPSELVTNGNFETGVNTLWNIDGATAIWNDTEIGKSGNYCAKLTKTATVITLYKNGILPVGKKCKFTMRYKANGAVGVSNYNGVLYGLFPATSEWNTVTKIITITTDTWLYISTPASILWIDDISVKEDQGFDLNKDQEQILHSKNWDFERTLGTELASGTVTIGSKYVVTAGTVEGNAIGTEFLAITNATTLDSSNKVKPIPNTSRGASLGSYDAPSDTFSLVGPIFAFAGFQYFLLPYKAYKFSFYITNYVSGTITAVMGNDGTGYISVPVSSGNGIKECIIYSQTLPILRYVFVRGDDAPNFSVGNFHIYEIPEWTASGNHTQNLSILDKSGTGTQSMLITASGAGRGAELVTNGTFDSNINSWTGSNGGVVSWESGSNAIRCTNSITAYGRVKTPSFSVENGKIYEISLNKVTSNPTSSYITADIVLRKSSDSSSLLTVISFNTALPPTKFTSNYTGTAFLEISTPSNTIGHYFVYDNISVKEVLGEVSLPSANIESVVSGKKYTLEGFARLDASSLTYGSDLVSGYNFTSGWGPSATVTVNSATQFTTSADGYLYKVVTGLTSKYLKAVISLSSTSSGAIYLGSNLLSIFLGGNFSGTFYFNNTNGDNSIQIRAFFADTITVSTLEIYASADVPKITAQLGTKSVTSSALSIVAGTFTKFVLNFEATASEQSQDLKLYLSGAGNVFVDKLSLTQRFDIAVQSKFKKTGTSNHALIQFGNAVTKPRLQIYVSSTNLTLGVQDNDSATMLTDASTLATPTSWHNLTFVGDSVNASKMYVDGVENDSITLLSTIGKTLYESVLTIGALESSAYFWTGQIASLQIIRFENIALSTFNSALTGLQYPTGGGSEEVLRLTFSDGTSFANCVKDYSPKNHSISNPGSTMDLNNRKRVV